MDDKSWDFYDNIRYDVLQFCLILLGKPCSDKDCLDHMKRCGTYDNWLVSMQDPRIGICKSNDYLKPTELEDAILDWLMNREKPANPEAITFQRCLLYEKRCRGESDAKDLFYFILKHALRKELPESNQKLLYPLFDFVAIWISLNNNLEVFRNKYIGGRVLLSDKTIDKLSKVKEAIQHDVYDKILSFEILDEEKVQIVKDLFGSNAVANMPKIKEEDEKAQKDFLRKLWDIYKDESTPKPKIRPRGKDTIFDFSVVAYYIWYDEFKINNFEECYRLLHETNSSFNNWKSARNKMSDTLYSRIEGRPTLEEAQEYVNERIKKQKGSDDQAKNEKLLKLIKGFLGLKEIYKEKLKEKRDNNERKA